MDFRSHHAQLIATAIAASVVTASLITAYSSYTRRERRKNLNEEILRSLALQESSSDIKSRVPTPPLGASQEYEFGGYDESLIREQLARNYAFFGEEGMRKIREGSVVIVGCGGVGSWAAVMLVRS